VEEATNNSGQANPALSGRGWVTLFLCIWVASLVVRLTFVADVLAQNSTQDIVRLHFDSREYLHLGKNLAERGTYEIDTAESRFFALLRTPGYPVFCALFLKLGAGVPGVLYAQAVLGSLIPLITAMLAGLMFRSRVSALAAGGLAIFSTTGIGLGAILLSDLLFAVAICAGFALLYAGAAREKRWGWLGAGLAVSAGIMLKPAIIYLGPVLIVGWFLMSRGEGQRLQWRGLACVIAMPLLAMGAWTAHNHSKTGHWVFSTIESQNLRHFMAPLTEEAAKAGALPDSATLMANHIKAFQRDLDDMGYARLTAADLAERQKSQAKAILLKNPGWAAIGMLNNAATCMFDGWAWTPSQLHEPGMVRDAMFRLNYWQIGGRAVLLGLSLLVGLERVLRGRAAASERERRREWGAMGACAAMLVYFFLISGTSFSTGFRILYPIEFALILLAIGGARAARRMLFEGATVVEAVGVEVAPAE
jgi:4-amino-4-deoxy-L-arabinose transferase-like glycosyltransferase